MPITGPDMIPIRRENYLIGHPTNFNKVLKKLNKNHHLHEIRVECGEEQYYDTFDWRLYRKKLVFTVSKNMLHLRKFSGTPLHSAAGRRRYKLFSWDIDDPQMALLLKKYIDMRALCPTVALRYNNRYFKILNRDRKTVAWVSVKSNTARYGAVEQELPVCLGVTSVRGYEKAYEKLLKSLTDHNLQTMVHGTELIDQAVAISHRKPLDYGAKFHVKLDQNVQIGTAVSKICLDLIGSMEINGPGVCDDIDSEFLHDFRIAVRRTRSLMSLLRKVMPEDQLRFFETEFKWLGSFTGPVRDIDVYLLKEETYRNLLPQSLRGGLTLFFEQLAAQRTDELTSLRKNLRSDRYRELLENWRIFLSDPQSELFKGVRKKSCLTLVNKIVCKRFHRFITDGDLINDQTDDEQLHKLRIKGKKFRYLLEFFRSFYAHKEIELFLKHMKKVQDNLGDFNDLSVQIAMLNENLLQLKGRNKQTIQLAAALGSLITMLKHEHGVIKGRFSKTYEAFRTEENKSLMKKLTIIHPSSASAKRKK
jgi:CHAD domain-containing protein